MTTHPGKYNLRLYRGSTFSKVITWKDESKALINLTGWKARLHMRATIDDANPFMSLTTENGGITLGGAAGTISLMATASATTAITITQGVYDLEMIAPDGVTVTRLLEGFVFISREVTR